MTFFRYYQRTITGFPAKITEIYAYKSARVVEYSLVLIWDIKQTTSLIIIILSKKMYKFIVF